MLGSRNKIVSDIYGVQASQLHFRARKWNLNRPHYKFYEILELKTDSKLKINITYHMIETLGTDSGKKIP